MKFFHCGAGAAFGRNSIKNYQGATQYNQKSCFLHYIPDLPWNMHKCEGPLNRIYETWFLKAAPVACNLGGLPRVFGNRVTDTFRIINLREQGISLLIKATLTKK